MTIESIRNIMTSREKTSTRVVRKAAKVLSKPSAVKAKSIAGSALTRSRTGKGISPKATTHASAVLRNAKSPQAKRSML